MPVDTKILEEMRKLKLDVTQIAAQLALNKHNHGTSTYHLLLKKHLISGGKSVADISVPRVENKSAAQILAKSKVVEANA